MMRRAVLLAVCAAALGACRKREERQFPKEDAPDIPREVAVQKLGELLQTAESVACTAPKDSLKASEVKEWAVLPDGIRIVPLKEKNPTFSVAYAEITQVRLDKLGKYFQARIFAPAQADPSKDFLCFTWRGEDTAKQVVELLEALRLKK